MALMSRYNGLLLILLTAFVLIPLGCRQDVPPSALPDNKSPIVRVRLLESRDVVKLSATSPPMVRAGRIARNP